MPRLSTKHHLHAHQQLQGLGRTNPTALTFLSPTERQYLLDYFQPNKDLTREQLLVHRRTITKQRPSLPQQAGRALAKLERLLASTPSVAVEPDLRLLASALKHLAAAQVGYDINRLIPKKD